MSHAFARASSVQIFMGCGHYVASVRAAEDPQDAGFYRDEILSELRLWTTRQRDDLTLVVLRYRGTL